MEFLAGVLITAGVWAAWELRGWWVPKVKEEITALEKKIDKKD